MSLIEEDSDKQVRMAHLAIVGTHSTNGVAAIHTELLRTRTVKDFAEMFPERFNNKTNGVTPRRWLLLANPPLAGLITEAIGDGWITDLSQLRKLVPLAEDKAFRAQFPPGQAGRQGPLHRLAASGHRATGRSGFDLRQSGQAHPRVQAAAAERPAHHHSLQPPAAEPEARTCRPAPSSSRARRPRPTNWPSSSSSSSTTSRRDRCRPAVGGRLKVLFLPDYNVSLAERLIPASDVSEQISTAGYEASGTSNMKFMMNGALTVGTRDGATIEMAQEAGEENFFLFGLTAEQVANSRGWYDPHWHYEHEPETRQALDLIAADHFSQHEPGIFRPILDTLLTQRRLLHAPGGPDAYTASRSRSVGALYQDRTRRRARRSSMSPVPASSPATAPSPNMPPTSGARNPLR